MHQAEPSKLRTKCSKICLAARTRAAVDPPFSSAMPHASRWVEPHCRRREEGSSSRSRWRWWRTRRTWATSAGIDDGARPTASSAAALHNGDSAGNRRWRKELRPSVRRSWVQ